MSGPKRRYDVATQRRAAQIEVHPREQVDHVPLVRRQMGERERGATVEAFIFLVVDLERADDDVAVIESLVLSGEVGIVKAGDAVMVVHEVVIEFTISVVPELVIRVHDRLVIVEYFQRLGIERFAQTFERRLRPNLRARPSDCHRG